MLSACVSVCLDINQGGTNRNRRTNKLVILRTQAYQRTLIIRQKLGPYVCLTYFSGQNRPPKNGRE